MAWSQITFQLGSIRLTYRLKDILFHKSFPREEKYNIVCCIKNEQCWGFSCHSVPVQIISGEQLRLNHFLIPRIPLKCHQMDHRPFLGLPSIKQFCQFAFVKLKSRVRWGPIISRFPNRSRWSCLQFGRHKMIFNVLHMGGSRRLQILESKISCY